MKKKIAAVLIIVVLLGILGSSVVVTAEDEYTLVRQFGRISKVVDQPGVSMKIPFVQTTDTYPKQTLLYDLVPSEVITRDKKDHDHRQLRFVEDLGSHEICPDFKRFYHKCRKQDQHFCLQCIKKCHQQHESG